MGVALFFNAPEVIYSSYFLFQIMKLTTLLSILCFFGGGLYNEAYVARMICF
jgi:hypothetical protein